MATCPVCLRPFAARLSGDVPVVLGCGHTVCRPCRARVGGTCPVCRARIEWDAINYALLDEPPPPEAGTYEVVAPRGVSLRRGPRADGGSSSSDDDGAPGLDFGDRVAVVEVARGWARVARGGGWVRTHRRGARVLARRGPVGDADEAEAAVARLAREHFYLAEDENRIRARRRALEAEEAASAARRDAAAAARRRAAEALIRDAAVDRAAWARGDDPDDDATVDEEGSWVAEEGSLGSFARPRRANDRALAAAKRARADAAVGLGEALAEVHVDGLRRRRAAAQAALEAALGEGDWAPSDWDTGGRLAAPDDAASTDDDDDAGVRERDDDAGLAAARDPDADDADDYALACACDACGAPFTFKDGAGLVEGARLCAACAPAVSPQVSPRRA